METISFVIPIRIDCTERLRNLRTVITNLQELNCHIYILEADQEQKVYLEPNEKVETIFVKDNDSVFYRTRYLNQLLKQAKTSIVGVWDADVIVPHTQIEQSVIALQQSESIFSSPYDGRFLMMDPAWSEAYCLTHNNQLLHNERGLKKLWEKPVWGGAFLVNRSAYLQCGGENEHFYGWGPEDIERVHRTEILGYPIHRSKGILYHLWHPRGANSNFGTQERANNNRAELIKICNMEKEELQTYIASWKSVINNIHS